MMKKTVSTFWVNWMIVVCVLAAIMGVVITYTPFIQQTLAPIYYNSFFTTIDAYSALPEEAIQFQRFMYGVSGAVLTSWLLSIVAIVHIPFRNGEKWAWWIILMTLLTWFIGDSTVSVMTGFTIHALANVSLFIALGIPLTATYNFFFTR